MISLEVKKRDDLLVVALVDASLDDRDLCDRVGGELLALADDASESKIVLDLGHVEYMSSIMVGQLFIFAKRCTAKQIALKMCRVSGLVRKVFNLVRLENFIEILPKEQDALDAFSQSAPGEELQNGERARKLRAGAEAGVVEDQFALANCLDEGRGAAQDFDEAWKWYQAAATNGHPGAQYHLGKSYAYGINVSQDYDQALTWYQKAAQQGHMEAQYAMGMSYNYGIGVPDDRDEACIWYRQAAQQGHEQAKKELKHLAGDSQ